MSEKMSFRAPGREGVYAVRSFARLRWPCPTNRAEEASDPCHRRHATPLLQLISTLNGRIGSGHLC